MAAMSLGPQYTILANECDTINRPNRQGRAPLQLTPAHIHFGTVQVGSVQRRTATLLNLAQNAARFIVATPAPPLAVSVPSRHILVCQRV